MTPEVPPLRTLPDAVQQTLHDLEKSFSLFFRISDRLPDGEELSLYATPGCPGDPNDASVDDGCVVRGLNPREGPDLELRIYGVREDQRESLPDLVTGFLGRTFEFAQEVRFFTYELSSTPSARPWAPSSGWKMPRGSSWERSAT
jgi:hypothetical protein